MKITTVIDYIIKVVQSLAVSQLSWGVMTWLWFGSFTFTAWLCFLKVTTTFTVIALLAMEGWRYKQRRVADDLDDESKPY